jgi:GNAT superfamily N-acetyltransferase
MELRRARQDEAEAIFDLHWLATRTAMPFLPELSQAGGRRFFAEDVLPSHEVWAAVEGEQLAGFVALKPGWIEHLAVHPRWQGRGVGRALMAKAMSDGTPRQLWTFQRNTRARNFYERLGFSAVRFTDGARNMEREPDVLYAWPGT